MVVERTLPVGGLSRLWICKVVAWREYIFVLYGGKRLRVLRRRHSVELSRHSSVFVDILLMGVFG